MAIKLNKKLLVTIHNQYDEGYKGNYELLAKGAKPLLTPDYFGPKVILAKYTEDEARIIDLIRSGTNDIDSISNEVQYILALKTIMKLIKNKIIIDQGGLYQLLVN